MSSGVSTTPSAWNLKQMLAKRLLRELLSKATSGANVGTNPGGGVVLVVDPHTSKILSSCLRMHDLLSAGVLVLQHLHLARERLPELAAVYFVEPTAEALEVIAEDFPQPPPMPAAAAGTGDATSAAQAALQALHLTGGKSSAAAAAEAAAAATAAKAAAAARCQYKCAHLFFTRSVSARRMAWLQNNSGMDMKRIKSFVELGADFMAFESRVFLLDRPHTIPLLYPLAYEDEQDGSLVQPEPSNSELLPFVAQLQSVCATALAAGERPYVRYLSAHVSRGRSALAQRFADLLDREFNKTAKLQAAAGAAPAASVVRNTTLLIVDRALDPLTPLMHEFTFQAMLQDLLKVQGEIVTLPTHQDKSKGKTAAAAATGEDSPDGGKPDPSAQQSEASESSGSSGELVLSEEDSLWCQYRHKHIGTVMAGVNRKLKEFASSNKMAQYQQMQNKAKAAKSGGTDKDKGKDSASRIAGGGGKDKDSSVKDVLKAVAEMPEYKLQMRRYAKHVALAEECLSKFKNRHLALVGELEQSMASNSTPEGAIYPPGSRELREDLKALVLDRAEGLEGRPLGVVDKLRLVVIYSLVHGGLPPNLAKVLSSSLHPELLESVLGDQAHLRALGADLESMEVQVSRARIDELHERNAAQSLALMRYVPVLHGIMEALLRNQLPETQFPYTKAGGAPAGHHFSTANAVAAAAQSQGLNSRRGSSTLPSPPGGGGSSLNNSGSGLTAEEKRRAKLLAEAEMDVAHRATGRSARRQRTEASTPAAASAASAAAAAGSSSSAAASPALSRHASDGDDNNTNAINGSAAQQPHRYIVFMLGGLTFSEMRSAYEVAAAHGTANGGVPDAPLLIGSTAALTPAEYLLDLSGLTRKEFFEKVLASASTAAAHSIASSEQAVRPVLNGQVQRSSRPLTQEELEAAERRGRNGVAQAVRNGGGGEEEGEEDDEEDDDHDDVSDPDSDDSSEDMGSPPPTATRGKGGGGGKSLMSSSAAKSRSGPASTAAPASSKKLTSAAAAKAEPSTSKKPKKVKELVFESESDGEGDEDRTPTPPPPRSSKSAAKQQQQASSAVAAASSRNSKKGSAAREPSTKASRRRNGSDED